ncbi:EF-hand domain-containing protein [Streptomyces sp. 5-10]|nr:EF-hand domain-containing protein [Streptomyces sp. 5-10]
MADSGGTDDDEVVIAAFKSFDDGGTIDSEKFRHALMTWGEKFSAKEVDDAFDAMDIDDNGRIDTQALITLLTAAQEEGEEGGEAA